ncbi:major allergen pru ar 1 [Phtheirospermum japonicum]|uniref:Major allergen pru ar 1 n=1 Tax=Phtheirospermum japonicum TaxID=374723 RepID=A0A830BN40_9LAMI|nr:major allergen pru ar 1 [Phtheirospermum japonicum]
MATFSYDMENTSSIPAAKMFKTAVIDLDSLIPKIMPQAIKSVEILEGDGGVGTVKIIHFGEGSPFKNVKQRVDAIDTENLSYTYSIIGGDALGCVLESITNHTKIVPTEDGGCVCKNTSTYRSKDGVELDQEKIKAGKDRALMMFKAIEAYLLANPDA